MLVNGRVLRDISPGNLLIVVGNHDITMMPTSQSRRILLPDESTWARLDWKLVKPEIGSVFLCLEYDPLGYSIAKDGGFRCSALVIWNEETYDINCRTTDLEILDEDNVKLHYELMIGRSIK